MKKNGLILICLLFLTIIGARAKSLNYKVYRADANSFYVSSVLVYGEKDAVLIDAQFTLADAHKLVGEILQLGKNLTHVYISHGDPDYYFGLEVIKNAFPNVKIYSSQSTLTHIKETYQKKLDIWGPKLGNNGTKSVVFPEVLKGNTILLEGEKIEVKGLDIHAKRTYVWIPSIKAIIGGVNIYSNLHLWIADASTKEERENWKAILDGMEKLNPKVVVAAHALLDENNYQEAIAYTRKYLITFEKAAKRAKNSTELIDVMKKEYPNAKLEVALEIGSKVVKGEMKW